MAPADVCLFSLSEFNQHCISILSPQTYRNKLVSDWLSSPAFQRWHHVPADDGQAVEEEESSYTSGLAGAREQWYVYFKYLYLLYFKIAKNVKLHVCQEDTV